MVLYTVNIFLHLLIGIKQLIIMYILVVVHCYLQLALYLQFYILSNGCASREISRQQKMNSKD